MENWFGISVGMERHRKVKRLRDAMHWSEDKTIASLYRFWSAVREQAPDGSLIGFDSGDVASCMKVGREHADKLMAAMIDAGFIDNASGIYKCHNWMERNGRWIKDANRKRDARAASKDSPRTVHGASALAEQSRAEPIRTEPKDSCPPDGGRLTLLPEIERPESKAPLRKKTVPPYWLDLFLKFWAVYPRKEAKADAHKAWGKIANPTPELGDRILRAARQYADSGVEPEFVKLPAGWIRSQRWEDEKSAPAPATLLRRPVNNDPYSTRWNSKCPGCGEPRPLPLGVPASLCETCKEARNGVQGR